MQTRWTKGLEGDAKTSMITSYQESNLIFRRLQELMDDLEEAAEIAALSKIKYELPSWSAYQADHIGYKRALNEIRDLIKK